MANTQRGRSESPTSVLERTLTGDDGRPVNVAVELVEKRPDTIIHHNLHHVADFEPMDFFLPLSLLLIIFVVQFMDLAMMGLFVVLVLQVALVRDLVKRIRRRPSGSKAVGLTPPYNKSDWWAAIGIYLLALPFAFAARWVNIKVFLWLFPNSLLGELYFGKSASVMSVLIGLGLFLLLMTFVTTVIFAPVTEELWFRGIGLASMQKTGGRVRALLLTILIFGLLHGPTRFLFSAVLGMAFGWFRYRTGSLYCSMALHAAHNFAVLMFAVVAAVSSASQAFSEMPDSAQHERFENDDEYGEGEDDDPDFSDNLTIGPPRLPIADGRRAAATPALRTTRRNAREGAAPWTQGWSAPASSLPPPPSSAPGPKPRRNGRSPPAHLGSNRANQLSK